MNTWISTKYTRGYMRIISKIQLGGMIISSVQSQSGPLRLPFVSKTEKRNGRIQNDEEVKEVNGLGAKFYFIAFEKLVMRAGNA